MTLPRRPVTPCVAGKCLPLGPCPPQRWRVVVVSSAQGRAAAQSRKDAGTISLLLVPKLQKVTSSVHLAPDRPWSLLGGAS